MGERIIVNGRELNCFDLPPEPKEYQVHVDGLGEITVTPGRAKEPIDWIALALVKMDKRLTDIERKLEGGAE